jgi:2'-5' RNA ligase
MEIAQAFKEMTQQEVEQMGADHSQANKVPHLQIQRYPQRLYL